MWDSDKELPFIVNSSQSLVLLYPLQPLDCFIELFLLVEGPSMKELIGGHTGMVTDLIKVMVSGSPDHLCNILPEN